MKQEISTITPAEGNWIKGSENLRPATEHKTKEKGLKESVLWSSLLRVCKVIEIAWERILRTWHPPQIFFFF